MWARSAPRFCGHFGLARMNASGPKPSRARWGVMLVWGAASLGAALSLHGPARTQDQPPAGSEITTQESTPKFRIQVERNVVQVRVVVRDSRGRVVGNLNKDDFRLTDNGKPQVITHFAVEDPTTRAQAAAAAAPEDAEAEDERPASLPDRYIAIFFDDVHIQFGDLVRTREAAEKYFLSHLLPGDRVAIFTSSGQNQVDFTDDYGKLHEALRKLQPRSIVPRRGDDCPDISDYQAYMISYRRDPYAIEIAAEEVLLCDPGVIAMGASMSQEELRRTVLSRVEFSARQVANAFQTESETAFRGLEGLIRHLSSQPGQRTLVLVSPGFLMQTMEHRLTQLIDRALRSDVVVNSLDAKGLYAHIALGDASRSPILPIRNASLVGNKARMDLDRVNSIAEVMRSLAYDTGGLFFTNSNDLDEGLRRVGALPEVSYALAFSPQNMKFDGNYHRIKVTLAGKARLTIQARKGYYAPSKPIDATAQAKEEIEQAIFSQAEVRELSVDIQTQFFKISDTEARLAVLTHLDLGQMQFRKENGRNYNNLTLVTVLFDRNGKYLDGKEKRVEFRLLDTSYEKLSGKGITSKTSFNVIPGTYVIRLVVRDSEGAQLSALNKRVEIPL